MDKKRYVILDRDGTIIVEKDYLSDPDQVELIPQAIPAIGLIRELGLGVIVVTNQSGVNRGYFTVDRLSQIHNRMQDLLREEDQIIDRIYYCPHRPDENCECRKPATGLVTRAARELGFKPAESYVVGDNVCDIELGKNISAVTILVETGYGKRVKAERQVKPDYEVSHVGEAAKLIQKVM